MAFPGIGRKHGFMIGGAVKMVASGNIVERRRADQVLLIFDGRVENPDSAGLAVGSVNVDDIPHVLRVGEAPTGPLERLLIPDGMPIARRSRLLTAGRWPRKTSADLLPGVGAPAEPTGWRVGFLGGSAETHERLAEQLTGRYPTLGLSGMWAPDPRRQPNAIGIADRGHPHGRHRHPGCDLGNPRLAQWIDHHGRAAGAWLSRPRGNAVGSRTARYAR